MSAQEWGLLVIKIAVAFAGQWCAYLYGRHTAMRQCRERIASEREHVRRKMHGLVASVVDSQKSSGSVSIREYEQNLDRALRRAVENME